MKKLAAIIILLAVIGWIVYKVVLPRIIIQTALNTESERYGSFIPREAKEQLMQLPSKVDSAGISREEAVAILNSIETADVLNSLDSLNNASVTSVDEAAALLTSHLNLSSDQSRALRTLLSEQFTLEEIRSFQALLNEKREMIPVVLPVFRETLKQLIRNPELLDAYKKRLPQDSAMGSG